ncbi:unnamed protein product [Rotaria sp. Silwood1]|nr:unnamed protein product [Rotaria sp. Silwood1]
MNTLLRLVGPTWILNLFWSGSDAKALVYYITDYVTKMSLSFHDTFALVQKSITSFKNLSDHTDKESAIERSRKLVLRCYNTLASQQELSGVQVASYLMNWDDHYTTHKFQGLYLIQTERFLQTELNEIRTQQKLELATHSEYTVIIEAEVDNGAIDPVLLPVNHDVHGEYNMDGSDDLLELLGNLDEYTTVAVNTTRKTTESKYIEETIEAVENVGRFNHTNMHYQSSSDTSIGRANRQLIPFLCATPHLVQLNTKWSEQLKIEKERVRRSLITRNYDKDDDTLDLFAARDAVVTVMNPNNYSTNNFENYGSILSVLKVINNFPTQTNIINEFTLNREQRAAVMIITSHLDGDSRCRTGDNNGQLIMCIPGCGGTGKSQLIRALTKYFLVTKRMQMMRKLAPTGNEFTLNREQRAAFMIITSHLDGDKRCRIGDNNGQLIMCIPGCDGTGKSQLIRALTKYFLVTKRMQMMRKLPPTGIAAAEIGGMTIHSFLGEQRNSGKP